MVTLDTRLATIDWDDAAFIGDDLIDTDLVGDVWGEEWESVCRDDGTVRDLRDLLIRVDRMGRVEEGVRSELSRIGVRRAEGERIRAEAMVDLAVWAHRAVGAGVDKSEIARLAGVTRPTVYAILDAQ